MRATPATDAPMNGRRAQAARNDQRITRSARAVFMADPGAPISAVAAHAGVGMSAVYRRYHSKEECLRELCGDGLRQFIAEARAALAADTDPWIAFRDFLHRVVQADLHSLSVRLAGTFALTDELIADAVTAQLLAAQVFDRARAAGGIRADVTVEDLAFLFDQVAAVHGADEERTARLRQRYLTLMLDAVHPEPGTPLPGPPPCQDDFAHRWVASTAPRAAR